jgi:hypothetical protein
LQTDLSYRCFHFMNQLIIKISTFILLVLSLQAHAQEPFKFEDELCQYEGIFDTTLYTTNQLADTYKLVRGEYGLYTNDEEQLHEDYKNAKEEINSLDIVNIKYFQSLKDSLLTFLDATYQIKNVEFQARKGETKTLLKYYQNNPTVKLYAESLYSGGEKLLKAYEHLTKEQMKNNGSPEILWEEYLKNSKSAQAQEIAFERVLSYGWWNAVNNLLPHINNDGTQFEEFVKLFTEVKTIDCDEV